MSYPNSLVGQEARIRKSIDALSATELANFLHATQKVQEKSSSDPTVNYSYAHMAGLHNIPMLFEGACEHWNYRFFAWHRALLFNYEDALRASDPPRTAQVTLPYWDWTLPPSGLRYPVVFENNPDGVNALYGEAGNLELLGVLFSTVRNSEASDPMYPWKYIVAIAKEKESETFLGGGSPSWRARTPAT